jgi:hypothetical protein
MGQKSVSGLVVLGPATMAYLPQVNHRALFENQQQHVWFIEDIGVKGQAVKQIRKKV